MLSCYGGSHEALLDVIKHVTKAESLAGRVSVGVWG